jgi:putative heme-binding domain-containing protein
MKLPCLCLLYLIFVGPLFAQRDLAKIPEPDPELERQSFQVAEGFEVNLFAADPLLAKPIQMNFDSAGRLWVACSEVYPQIVPGQKANDKIIILEDTQGKGKADKVTVFADGLLIPTGIEPGDGGAYIANSTELIHLKPAQGTGKALERRVVLSGFGTEDTHHILHTLRWGPDGMLYFNQSVYIHSHIETPHGVRRLGGGGIWRFRPETMELSVFVRGFINPWGHHFDRWGQSFATDGAFGEGVNYLIPDAYYIWAVGEPHILPGLNPGSPKHCGLEILSGRHLPPAWQGNLLTNDFRGHRVCRFVLKEDGAAYTSQERPELIKTNHAAFRPVDIKMGPDGAIYIADWYNPIIQHGEVDFRDPRRDHTHGRIWRVTAKGRPLVPRPGLQGAKTEELLNALKMPEDWTRHHAKHVLKERGPEILPELRDWLSRLNSTNPDWEHHLLEALWTYQSLNVVEPKLLQTLIHAKDPRVRAAAARVLCHWHTALPDALEWLTALVADPHPQVRLEAVRGLSRLPHRRAMELALQALDRPMDRFLEYGLWLTARELSPVWLPQLQNGQMDFNGNTGHLLFALEAADARTTVGILVNLLQAGKVPREKEESIWLLIARMGGPRELALIFAEALKKPADFTRQTDFLAALESAARQRAVRPEGDLSSLGKLLADADNSRRAFAARLAGLWKMESLRPELTRLATATDTSDGLRPSAMEGLALLGGSASSSALAKLSGSSQPLQVRVMAVVALAGVDLPSAAQQAVAVLEANPAADPAAEIFTAFVQRRKGPALLAKAVANRRLPQDIAKIGVRTVRLSGKDFPDLVTALTKAGGITPGPHRLSPEEMRQMVANVLEKGDPARGETVFRRKDQACLNCHCVGGAGGQVGPDLAGIGASAPIDYLIESILEPNKAIKEGYHALVVGTKDGRLFTGIKVRETSDHLTLRDAQDKEIVIPLASIDEKSIGGSLMPEGLADPLTRQEFLDLIRFLSDLGKIGPYSLPKAPMVRRWLVLERDPAALDHLRRSGLAAAASNHSSFNWVPAYSRVSGTLPLDAVPSFEWKLPATNDAREVGFLRCQLDVSTAGKVKLAVNSAAGLSAWLNGLPFTTGEEMILDLTPGLHTVTFSVTLHDRNSGLRCTLEDVSGSSARVRLVGGK